MEKEVESLLLCDAWLPLSFSVLTSFYNAEDESNLLLPKLPTLPKKYVSVLFLWNGTCHFSSAFNMVPISYAFLTSIPYLYFLLVTATPQKYLGMYTFLIFKQGGLLLFER